MQSPLGPQAQQEEGKSEVQQGTHVDDQESNWSAPGDLKRFKVEDEGGDIDDGGGVELPEHERHWSGSGPEQVAQEVWQARHSAELDDKKNLGKELWSQALKYLTVSNRKTVHWQWTTAQK